MSNVRIFRMNGGDLYRTAASAARRDQPQAKQERFAAPQAELVSDLLEQGERLDERLTKIEHVPGNGVWAKRRALGEGNRLGLVRGYAGSGCGYIIQARVPDPALQTVQVRRDEREDVEETQEARSWADEITYEDADAEQAAATVSVSAKR